MTLFNHRIALFSISLILLGLCVFRIYERYFSREAEILFFDTGQGESILLKLPRGKAFLVDLGSSSYPWRVGEEIVRELGRKGILTLDGLVISHPDGDHVGGVFSLFRHISIKSLFYSGALETKLRSPSKLLEQLKAEALSRKTTLSPISEMQVIKDPDYQLTHTSVVPQKKVTANNLSLVSLLEIYGCRFLLTGDIEKETEQELLKKVLNPVHVLKVAHHGSITSSHREFLEKLRPLHAVISVGEKNRYGHPRKEVLQRIRFFKTKIFRTDFHGFVSYRVFPGGKVRCGNALGSCGEFRCEG
jgi:competence protein ComEC